jgi:NAD(P)-dependent dehydrogenase (short-subunit alcohol dehydrogenase family)
MNTPNPPTVIVTGGASGIGYAVAERCWMHRTFSAGVAIQFRPGEA